MKGTTLLIGLAVLAAIVIASSAEVSQPETQDDSASGWGRFGVLTERNIFLRDRAGARPQSMSSSAEPAVTRDPDEDLVLAGVIHQGGVAEAFIENGGTGEITRLRVGDSSGKGQISAITLDNIEYSRDGERKRIEVGQTLLGGPASPPISEEREQTTATATGRNEAIEAPSTDVSAILERMRDRRQRELRQ